MRPKALGTVKDVLRVRNPKARITGSSTYERCSVHRSIATSSNALEREKPRMSNEKLNACKDIKSDEQTATRKSQADIDKELAARMAAIAGDGGAAGVEYEDGQPVAMKRSVRENMFRLI